MAALPHLKEGTPEWALITFLKQHRPIKPLIVAVSGGSDSITLYRLLHWAKRYIPLKLIIAHVHHGVRTESDNEERYVRELAEGSGDPIFVKKLGPIKANFEEVARIQRYEFFLELFQTHDAEGCLLAHHADDLAETVLKRIFEGAPFETFKAMQEVGSFKEMPLWRPFISLPKKALLLFPHFEDATNLHGNNLRAKMRRELIPMLENAFGKNIQPSIQRLSNEATEFSSYLDSLFPPFELEFDRNTIKEYHPFLVKQYVRRWLKFNNLKYTEDQLDKLKIALISKKSGQFFIIGGKKIKVSPKKVSIELV
jgi:tRNA(Ile)-lysidine synthetase, N-terminal domain